jgi:hypothetical protein
MTVSCRFLGNFGIWESEAFCCSPTDGKELSVRHSESHATQNDMCDSEDDGEVKTGLHTG